MKVKKISSGLKTYKFKIEREPFEPIAPPRPVEGKEEEVLSGVVKGKTASDLEERFAKSQDKMQTVNGYEFRYVFFGPRNSAGSVEVDFLTIMSGGRVYVVLIDGEYAHKSAAQKGRDAINDQKLWSELKGQISAPPIRIPADKLSTQEDSDATAKELLL
jgi:hypothetical protein